MCTSTSALNASGLLNVETNLTVVSFSLQDCENQKLYFLEEYHRQMCTDLHFVGLNLAMVSKKGTFSLVPICSAFVC